jgi:hypothetical protein
VAGQVLRVDGSRPVGSLRLHGAGALLDRALGSGGEARAVYPGCLDAPEALREPSADVPLRPVEGHAAIAQRDPGVVADHEVVEEIDVEEAAARQRLGREVEIVG